MPEIDARALRAMAVAASLKTYLSVGAALDAMDFVQYDPGAGTGPHPCTSV